MEQQLAASPQERIWLEDQLELLQDDPVPSEWAHKRIAEIEELLLRPSPD